MTGRIAGKVVVLTGGSSGIGAGCARRLAAEGAAAVVIGDLDPTGETVAEDLASSGTPARFVPTDVSVAGECAALVDAAVEFAGRVDIGVAAAGISHGSYLTSRDSKNPRTPLVDVTPEEWHRVLDVNLDGVFYFDQAVARHLQAREAAGSIVNIASMNSQRTSPGVGPYSVSKAAVWMLTKSFALELAPGGTRVNAVAPGYISTPMTDRMFDTDPAARERVVGLTPLARMGRPEDIANAVLYLASDEAAFVTGTLLYADGGYMAAER